MLSQQELILSVAREHQKETEDFHMQEFDHDYAEYPIITSYILCHPPERKERSKANIKNDGPVQIQNRIGDISY